MGTKVLTIGGVSVVGFIGLQMVVGTVGMAVGQNWFLVDHLVGKAAWFGI